MFEKEAETTFKKKATKVAERKVKEFYKECGWEDYKYMIPEFADVGIKCMQKGAEFAYNKANEWHYPSKGEYPTKELEEKQLLLRVRNYTEDCIFAYYMLDKYYSKNGKRFYSDTDCDYPIDIEDIIAWKKIVLPELPKE